MAKKRNPQKKRSNLPVLLMIVGGLLLLAAVVTAVVLGSTGASGSPRLKADQEVIDFGEVKLGKTVTATFTLTNTGDAPIRFSEAPYVELVEGC